jgi:hypothetical protein
MVGCSVSPPKIQLGPVMRQVLQELAPRRPFSGCRVSLSARLTEELPSLGNALDALGADTLQIRCDSLPLLELETPSGKQRLIVELALGDLGYTEEEVFSTAAIPAVRYVLERWQLDYLLWNELLPSEARGSLPGRRLWVEGYGVRGRLIAWRAREMGIEVVVVEGHPVRQLEALYDGFETASEFPASDSLVVRTADGGIKGAANCFRPPTSVPPGIADELATAVIVSLYVLRIYRHRSTLHRDATAVAGTIDRLLLEALITARDPNHVSRRLFWSPDSW